LLCVCVCDLFLFPPRSVHTLSVHSLAAPGKHLLRLRPARRRAAAAGGPLPPVSGGPLPPAARAFLPPVSLLFSRQGGGASSAGGGGAGAGADCGRASGGSGGGTDGTAPAPVFPFPSLYGPASPPAGLERFGTEISDLVLEVEQRPDGSRLATLRSPLRIRNQTAAPLDLSVWCSAIPPLHTPHSSPQTQQAQPLQPAPGSSDRGDFRNESRSQKDVPSTRPSDGPAPPPHPSFLFLFEARVAAQSDFEFPVWALGAGSLAFFRRGGCGSGFSSGPFGLHSGPSSSHSGPSSSHSGPSGLHSGPSGLHSGPSGLHSSGLPSPDHGWCGPVVLSRGGLPRRPPPTDVAFNFTATASSTNTTATAAASAAAAAAAAAASALREEELATLRLRHPVLGHFLLRYEDLPSGISSSTHSTFGGTPPLFTDRLVTVSWGPHLHNCLPVDLWVWAPLGGVTPPPANPAASPTESGSGAAGGGFNFSSGGWLTLLRSGESLELSPTEEEASDTQPHAHSNTSTSVPSPVQLTSPTKPARRSSFSFSSASAARKQRSETAHVWIRVAAPAGASPLVSHQPQAPWSRRLTLRRRPRAPAGGDRASR